MTDPCTTEYAAKAAFIQPSWHMSLLLLIERSYVNCIAACRSQPESGDKLPDAGDKVRQLTNCRDGCSTSTHGAASILVVYGTYRSA